MKSLFLCICLSFTLVGCGFTNNKTIKDSWGNSGSTKNAGGNGFGNGSTGGSDNGSTGGDNGSTGGSDNGSTGSDNGSTGGDNGSTGGSDNGSTGGDNGSTGPGECDVRICKDIERFLPGLNSELFALKKEYISKSNKSSIIDLLNPEKLIPIDQFRSLEINTAPRFYDIGVVGREHEIIQDPRSNNELLEYYLIKYEGLLEIKDPSMNGEYEFALISDDGVLLKLNNKTVIKTNLYHSPRMDCMEKSIKVKVNKPIKIDLYYHQGMKNHVANMLVWRKVKTIDAGSEVSCHSKKIASSYCGKDIWNTKPLFNEGWEVVPQTILKSKNRLCSN